MRVSLAVCLLIVVGSGCSSIQVKPIESESEHGLRFYQPEPYLLVSVTEVEDTTTKLKSEIIWLPNFKKGYVAKPTGYVGSSNIKLTLNDGWNLSDFGLNRDSKGPEIVEAIAGLVTAVAALDKVEILQPGLYQFVYDDEGHVKSLRKLATN